MSRNRYLLGLKASYQTMGVADEGHGRGFVGYTYPALQAYHGEGEWRFFFPQRSIQRRKTGKR